MPCSEPLFDAKILAILRLIRPQTVLDIGPGAAWDLVIPVDYAPGAWEGHAAEAKGQSPPRS